MIDGEEEDGEVGVVFTIQKSTNTVFGGATPDEDGHMPAVCAVSDKLTVPMKTLSTVEIPHQEVGVFWNKSKYLRAMLFVINLKKSSKNNCFFLFCFCLFSQKFCFFFVL